MTEGRLDEPLEGTGGRDEITDLGAALETMRDRPARDLRRALARSATASRRSSTRSTTAVMVVGPDGEVAVLEPAPPGR